MTRHKATFIGFTAVLLWSFLALFTVGTVPTPPFLLSAICFAIASVIGFTWVIFKGDPAKLRRVDWKVYAIGTVGIFGYHALYFSSLRLAPPAEAGLINYLWPLLIVLMSGLLPGEKLTRGHISGALLGFAGAAFIILGNGAGFQVQYLPGYLFAIGGAFAWSGYSVLSRKFGDTPTEVVAVYCVFSAILAIAMHMLTEATVLPGTALGWASVAALGIGPVGLAFYVWDFGLKNGDIQLLGTSAYLAPLLSTAILVLAGVTAPTWGLAAAAILITLGAALAAGIFKK